MMMMMIDDVVVACCRWCLLVLLFGVWRRSEDHIIMSVWRQDQRERRSRFPPFSPNCLRRNSVHSAFFPPLKVARQSSGQKPTTEGPEPCML
jgi:hypothetical protein